MVRLVPLASPAARAPSRMAARLRLAAPAREPAVPALPASRELTASSDRDGGGAMGTARPVVGHSTMSTSGSGRRGRLGNAPWLLIPVTVEARSAWRRQPGTDTPSSLKLALRLHRRTP